MCSTVIRVFNSKPCVFQLFLCVDEIRPIKKAAKTNLLKNARPSSKKKERKRIVTPNNIFKLTFLFITKIKYFYSTSFIKI